MSPLRRAFQRLSVVLTPFIILATLGLVSSPVQVGASSHREAPLISKDPSVDNVDVYAFVSPDAPSTVTLIATWIPFEEPGGGPNFYHFDDLALYNIKVDNNGDAIPDLTYEWTFETELNNSTVLGPTWLYNDGVLDAPGDPNFLYTQYYTLTEVLGDNTDATGALVTAGRNVLFSDVQMAPDNIGPRSTPNYEALAAKFIQTRNVAEGTIKEFTGQREDPFYVDVNSIFDLGGLRPFNSLHLLPLRNTAGLDSTAGYNVHANIIQVPIKRLAPQCPINAQGVPTAASDPRCVIGVWSSSDRPKVTTKIGLSSLANPGGEAGSGGYVQVSRLGMPLTNEVIVPLALKDAFNALKPELDQELFTGTAPFPPALGQLVQTKVLTPDLQLLLPVLYPKAFRQSANADGAANLPPFPRLDLFTIFFTGIPGVNQQVSSGNPLADPTKTASEQLRLNTGIPPTAAVCQGKRLGPLDPSGPDLAGFPNGRRLEDDATDIALRAVAGGYGPTLAAAPFNLPNLSPGNLLSDGVDKGDKPCLTSFPYVGTPHSGYNRVHALIAEIVVPVVFKNAR